MAEGMSLTPKQLQDLITAAVTAAVAESKKPAPLTDRELAEIEQAQDMRLQQRDLTLAEQARKAADKRACTHMRRDNTCSGVYVANGGYIICQQCQGIIKPAPAPEGYSGDQIFDTNLFNRLFTLTNANEAIM